MAKNKKSNNQEKPGASGEGEFYHIEIRSSRGFEKFRTQDVGDKGGLERVAGQRKDGSWDTVKWLVSKEMAHVNGGKLIADHEHAKQLFDEFDTQPRRVKGDIFKAKTRPQPPETHKKAKAQTK